VTAVGLASYARRDPEVAGVMVLPGLLLGGTLLLLEHNLWPRFFFFSFGFAALIVARGVFGTANRVAGSHATRLATLAMVVLITVSATTVPRAWHPKQDYVGAKAFVQEHRAGGDAVAVVDLATYAYAAYLQTDWSTVASVDDLRALEAAHQVVWVVFTFPARIEALHPDLWRVLAAEYREVTEYRGTVGGGDIMVLRKG
jgi:hypothetical protein